jgi:hypothetical protein
LTQSSLMVCPAGAVHLNNANFVSGGSLTLSILSAVLLV